MEKTIRYKWVFYVRFACKHFNPCSECQKKIDKYVEKRVGDMDFQKGYQIVEGAIVDCLCKECRKKLAEKIMDSNRIILGNRDYEPLFELQRETESRQNRVRD